MMNSFSAEVLKLRKRPAMWVLGAIPVALVVAYYLLGYSAMPEGSERVQDLLPQNAPSTVLLMVSFYGGAVVLIFGAMAVGSEYGWDTLKVALPRRQSRPGFLTGKLLTAGAALVILSVAMLVAGLLCSLAVARLAEAPIEWPSIGVALKGLGAAWLILAAWASLGLSLAILFRSTALALGLGLVYGLAIQNVITQLSGQSTVFEFINEAVLLSTNGQELVNSLGESPAAQNPDPTGAALTMAAYLVGSVLLAMVLFWRRDVT